MKLRTLLFTVSCIAVLLPGSAGATNLDNGLIATRNDTSYRLWVTVYDAGKTRHMDYGTVEKYERRAWNNCCYAAGSIYHVRAEVQKFIDGRDRTIFDTSIQVTPKLCITPALPGHRGDPYGYAEVSLRKGTGETFYWDNTTGGCSSRAR